jgi:hypothetical protein
MSRGSPPTNIFLSTDSGDEYSCYYLFSSFIFIFEASISSSLDNEYDNSLRGLYEVGPDL